MPAIPPTPRHPIVAAALPGIEALRRLWLPFVLIQACALAVVIGYFNSATLRELCETLARWKTTGGYLFAAAMFAFSGGVLPEVFKFLVGVNRTLDSQRFRNVAFVCALYAVLGVTTDALQRWMAGLFGAANPPAVVVAKMAIDQFLYTPLFCMPFIAFVYTWREHHFRLSPTLKSLGLAWYVSRVATILIPTWAFWVPMATLMYTLPATLNIIFGALASAASATVVLAVAERKVARPHHAMANEVPA